MSAVIDCRLTVHHACALGKPWSNRFQEPPPSRDRLIAFARLTYPDAFASISDAQAEPARPLGQCFSAASRLDTKGDTTSVEPGSPCPAPNGRDPGVFQRIYCQHRCQWVLPEVRLVDKPS